MMLSKCWYKQKNLVVQKRYSEAKNQIKMSDKFIGTNKKLL